MKADAAGVLRRFVDDVDFDAAAADESFGRWTNGVGRLYPMVSTTLGAANSGPRIGPVIISEVMYNPGTINDDLEFVELYNITGAAIDLTNWKLDNGVTFTFPSGTSLPARGTLVVVHFDPANAANSAKLDAFRTAYNIGPGVPLVGSYLGVLDNNGETLRLARPDVPPPDEPTFIPYLLVDEVRYLDVAPWPVTPDGTGPSLTRKSQAIYGDEATNWLGATATPGAFNAKVVGRQIFYNESVFDGNSAIADAADDVAIATDKAALLPGNPATFANYTSYNRGITGIMVDIQGLPPGTVLSPSDFSFKVGNSNTPSVDWTVGPAPAITLRPGAGTGGSDRIELTWGDSVIRNQWVQVTVNSTSNLGLGTPDLFYFGNAVGETGNSPGDATVNGSDEILARNNPATFVAPATVVNKYDFNRDGFVNAADQILARSNSTTFNDDLNLITVPAALGLAAAGPSASQAVLQQDNTAAIGVALSQHASADPVSLPAVSQPATVQESRDNQRAASAYFAALGGADPLAEGLPRRLVSAGADSSDDSLFDLLD